MRPTSQQRLSAAVLASLAVLGSVGCSQNGPSPNALPSAPNAPVAQERQQSDPGALLASWLEHYNRSDVTTFMRFAAERYSAKELSDRDAATIATGVGNWFHNYGRFEPVGQPILKPGEAEAVVRMAGVDACARLYVETDPAEPNKIGAVYLSPFETVECGERVTRVGTFSELVTQTKSYMDDLAAQDRFSGVLLLTRASEPLIAEARGFADPALLQRNEVDTLFELASVSKMLTAVTIARLVEQRKLSWSDSVGELLPEFPGRGRIREVTVEQLLSHTSGIADYYRNGSILRDFRHRQELSEYWPLFAHDELNFDPGTKYDYSNSNYVLLGSVIEEVTGLSFARAIDREVLRRAGMSSTCYCSPGEVPFARPHSKYSGLAGPSRRPVRNWITVRDDWPRPAPPAGYSLATAGDLSRFLRAILEGRLVSHATLKRMLRPVSQMDNEGIMGLGLMMYEVGGIRTFGHDGSSWGVRTQVEAYPELDTTLVILANSDAAGTEALKYKLRKWLGSLTPDMSRGQSSGERGR